MLGEVPERLVVGHQLATICRQRVQESRNLGIGGGDRGLVVVEARVDATGVEPGACRRGRREALAARRTRASDRTRRADRPPRCSGSSLASGVISIGEAEDRRSVLCGGVDRVLQRLLEQQAVGDDEVGILQHLTVAQRRLERVRITTDRDDGLDLGEPVTRHMCP